jgi:hypothetical protein
MEKNNVTIKNILNAKNFDKTSLCFHMNELIAGNGEKRDLAK